MGTALDEVPNQFDIAWCLFPKRGGKMQPGDVVRPTLILDVRVSADDKYGVVCTYGTGVDDNDSPFLDDGPDLVVREWKDYTALGLHKPTRFSISPTRRLLLPWTSEYFVAPPYVRGADVICGELISDQIERVKMCFKMRGLEPYWR
jgi:hypothetical protein